MTEPENDAGEIVAEFKKSATEVIRISLRKYKGADYVDVRTWFYVEGGELRPTQKGVRIHASALPAMLKGFQAVFRKLNVSADNDAEPVP